MSMAAGRNAISISSVCTCKICDHSLARDCANVGCTCCSRNNHSMVMDGIEGFLPPKSVKPEQRGATQNAEQQ